MSEMKTYVARSKFTIAKPDHSNLIVDKGDRIEFNGTQARYEGSEHILPKLSVAVKAGWLQDVTVEALAFQPKSAGIKLSAATPQQESSVSQGVTRMSEEEKVVGVVQDRTDSREEAREVKTSAVSPAQPTKAPTRLNMPVVSSSNENATVLKTRKFKHSTQPEKKDLGSLRTEDLNKLASVADSPHLESDVVVAEGMTFANENISRRATGDLARPGTSGDSDSIPVGAEAGTVVSTVQRVSRSFENAQPEVELEEDWSEEIEFDVQAEDVFPLDDDLDPKTKEGRYNVAKIILPDLPEWDFTEHWTKKMSKLRDETDLMTLRAIYASESEAIKRRMVKELGLAV